MERSLRRKLEKEREEDKEGQGEEEKKGKDERLKGEREKREIGVDKWTVHSLSVYVCERKSEGSKRETRRGGESVKSSVLRYHPVLSRFPPRVQRSRGEWKETCLLCCHHAVQCHPPIVALIKCHVIL